MNRRDFSRITMGVLTALGSGRRVSTRGWASADSAYLERGLIAMARANHWFPAHWGAAILAGTYLCAENDLGAEVEAAIRAQLDIAIEKNSAAFRPFSAQQAREESIAEIARSLEPALSGGLREHGHAVIYTALATRALRDVPHMAVPSIIDGIRRHIVSIGRVRPQRPRGEARGYRDTQSMIEATFESLLRFEPLVGRPKIHRPNFTHQVTHTEALARLDSLGLHDLAERGHRGHGVHLDMAVPAIGDEQVLDRSEVTLAGILRSDFWVDRERLALWHVRWNRRANPNGDWIASGHLFKVLYAFCSLAKRIPDDAVVERSATVLLERYFHPEVLGG